MKWGDFWIADLSGGEGSEQGGLRPVIIIQNDIGNKYSPTTIVCPITTKQKNYNATHVMITGLSATSYIMCEQLRVVDKSRLKRYLGCIAKEDKYLLREKLKITLAL